METTSSLDGEGSDRCCRDPSLASLTGFAIDYTREFQGILAIRPTGGMEGNLSLVPLFRRKVIAHAVVRLLPSQEPRAILVNRLTLHIGAAV
jgi:hypothetical protein